MSGPYGYGGYSGYGPPQRGGYGYAQPRYPPGQPPQQPPPGGPAGYSQPGFPPGQPPRYPPGQQTGYQGYQQQPGYGMPGFRPPLAQPQGYTPAEGTTAGYVPPMSQPAVGTTAGYVPPMSQPPPMVTAGHAPTVNSANHPLRTHPMYSQPARAAPGPPMMQQTRPTTMAPAVPQSFPELYTMSKEDLEKLMDNAVASAEYFENQDDIKRLQEERRKIVERNEELASENLSLKPRLEEKQQELIELYAELEAERNELNDLQQQQQALADHYAPHNILARLKIAASEIEDESEGIAENFLNGDIAIDEFLKTYIPKKTLCHSRRAKEEKMERMGI